MANGGKWACVEINNGDARGLLHRGENMGGTRGLVLTQREQCAQGFLRMKRKRVRREPQRLDMAGGE